MIEILESGPNTLTVGLGNRRVYFSYKTPIAFYTPKTGLVVRQNNWSNTTGKHLNAIDGGNKAARIPGAAFKAQLTDLFDRG